MGNQKNPISQKVYGATGGAVGFGGLVWLLIQNIPWLHSNISPTYQSLIPVIIGAVGTFLGGYLSTHRVTLAELEAMIQQIQAGSALLGPNGGNTLAIPSGGSVTVTPPRSGVGSVHISAYGPGGGTNYSSGSGGVASSTLTPPPAFVPPVYPVIPQGTLKLGDKVAFRTEGELPADPTPPELDEPQNQTGPSPSANTSIDDLLNGPVPAELQE